MKLSSSLTALTAGLVLCAPLAAPMAAQAAAGPATDALSKCLVAAATPDDHIVLADWIFTVIARHPSVQSMVNISDAQRTDIDKKAGALFSRLMIDNCGAELKLAVEQDGTDAVQSAFGVLGGAAMSDLMEDPKVQAAFTELSPYFDETRLAVVLGGATPPAK